MVLGQIHRIFGEVMNCIECGWPLNEEERERGHVKCEDCRRNSKIEWEVE